MIAVVWGQLVLGLMILACGVVTARRSRAGARTLSLLGLMNAACAAALLVWHSGSDIRGLVLAGYGVFLLVLCAVFVPRSWHTVRSVILPGTITCLALVALLYAGAGSLTQAALLIVVIVTAPWFLIAGLVRTFRRVRNATAT